MRGAKSRIAAWASLALLITGLSPLIFRIACGQKGLSSNRGSHVAAAPVIDEDDPVRKRVIKVEFVASTFHEMPWEFKPAQKSLLVSPGETALAFFKAKNLSSAPIVGYAIYYVTPGPMQFYFNKVQCFCFEEQLLAPGEEIDLPVLFYIDPAVAKDGRLDYINQCVLAYGFVETGQAVPDEFAALPHVRAELEAQGRLRSAPSLPAPAPDPGDEV